MLEQGVTSALEERCENGSWRHGQFSGFQRTHSHAWSGCPATSLAQALGGIEPMEPGGARVRVKPQEAPFPCRVGRRMGRGLVTVDRDGRGRAWGPRTASRSSSSNAVRSRSRG